MNTDRPIELVPYGSDLLDALAGLMLERHQSALPDLSRIAVIFPTPHAIARFRRLLLDHAHRLGHTALLPPWCGTLDAWLAQHQASNLAVLSETDRELLLLQALEPYSGLRERFGTWPLVSALLGVFDELNTHRQLPLPEAGELIELLAAGYGAELGFEPLRAEAELIHQLWTAWNSHLVSQGLVDAGLYRLAALAASEQPGSGRYLYIVSMIATTGSERDWLKRLLNQRKAILLLQGSGSRAEIDIDPVHQLAELLDLPLPQQPPSDAYARFIEASRQTEPELANRARSFANTIPQSPAVGRLRYFEATDFEQEARAVDLAIRRWLSQGVTDIGFVTQDRKLARRVRALLERANISLRDSAGWALSTTSAAAVVMRWIECTEQNFAHEPLLDLLKSPFVDLGFERAELDRTIASFERHVVRGYNVTSDLTRYRRIIDTVGAALAPGDPDIVGMLQQLCERLAKAADPLLRALHGKARTPQDYLAALRDSLDRLGLTKGLSRDDAGYQLLAALTQAHDTTTDSGAVRLSWIDFRGWLTRELERQRFRPTPSAAGVELLGLNESRCLHFQAVVVAGCNRDQIPGPMPLSPFFNDGVRQRLGLPTREQRLALQRYDFYRLLQAAPQILLTRRQTERGEALVASPWVDQLMAFHRVAYQTSLADTSLPILLRADETELYQRVAPLPPPAPAPAARLPRHRLPAAYTASSHQRLIDCPYQFFALDGLQLRPLEPMREEMEKLDYGKRIHRILQAFHGGVAGLPGPWHGGAITAANRNEAAQLLRELGHTLFAKTSDPRLSARGWRYRWEEFIPVYLDWQEARDRSWKVESTETALERTLLIGDHEVSLRGRADRVERGAQGLAVLDYKTGTAPDATTVSAGEHVQLPFYALLAGAEVVEVGYVRLGSDDISVQTSGDIAVTELARLCEVRLKKLIEALQEEHALPAWGDSVICGYCRFEGLCRKEMWDAAG